MQLTPHQQERHNEVIALFKAGHKRVILEGDAGTGKTTTADQIFRTLKKDYTINPNYNNGTLYGCAPTNKALAVMQRKISTPVEFKTIHSALKLRQVTNSKSGIETFIKQKTYGRPKPDDFDQCKAVLIDECSMLGKSIEGAVPELEIDEQDKEIQGYLSRYKMPILYLGDNKQLPPVKESYSPVFNKGYPVVRLLEIVRQGANNPIIDLSHDIDMIFFKQPNVVDGKGYIYSNAKDQFIETLAEVNGSDDFKYLAYVNTDIDSMNKAVRERIYTTPRRVEEGEYIVFNKPFLKHFTNEEVKIESLDVVTDYIDIPTAKTKYDEDYMPFGAMDKIKLKYYRVNDEFNVLHEQSDKIFHSICMSVKDKCNHNDWSFYAKKYVEEKLFVDFKYNHAITVHKSQGSTYKECVINIGNIMINNKADERQRMLYTAVTRASDLIILTNTP
jgi:exodeoxyribonuclease-5